MACKTMSFRVVLLQEGGEVLIIDIWTSLYLNAISESESKDISIIN